MWRPEVADNSTSSWVDNGEDERLGRVQKCRRCPNFDIERRPSGSMYFAGHALDRPSKPQPPTNDVVIANENSSICRWHHWSPRRGVAKARSIQAAGDSGVGR